MIRSRPVHRSKLLAQTYVLPISRPLMYRLCYFHLIFAWMGVGFQFDCQKNALSSIDCNLPFKVVNKICVNQVIILPWRTLALRLMVRSGLHLAKWVKPLCTMLPYVAKSRGFVLPLIEVKVALQSPEEGFSSEPVTFSFPFAFLFSVLSIVVLLSDEEISPRLVAVDAFQAQVGPFEEL